MEENRIKGYKHKLLIVCVLLMILLSMSIVSANEENSSNIDLKVNSVVNDNVNVKNIVECNVLVDGEIQKENVTNSISLNEDVENMVGSVAAGSGETKAIATGDWEKAKNAIESAVNGGTVYLNGTMYNGNGCKKIIVNKNITIHGGSKDNKKLVSTLDMNRTNGIMLIEKGCVVNIVNVNFLNGSSNRGGAIYCENNVKLTVTNCNFTDSYRRYNAMGEREVGFGAIYLAKNCDLSLSNSRFTNNYGDYVGAICSEDNLKLTIDNCDFTNNTAGDRGVAAIKLGKDCDLSVSNSRFINNRGHDGGAIYGGNNLKFTVTNCNFTDGYGDINGGAIYGRNNVKLTVTNCNFNDNFVYYNKCAGAIMLGNYANLSIYNSRFIGNDGQYGGAIGFGNYGNLSVNNSKFINNSNDKGICGGAIYFENNVKVNMTNCDFINNQKAGAHEGGAIWGGNNIKFNITNCNFADNYCYGEAGAIRLANNCNLSVNNSKFTKNYGNWGGAIYMLNGASLVVLNSEFTNNTSTNPGQTIYVQNSVLVYIESSKFIITRVLSSATLNFGGSNKNITVSNCEFTCNDKYSDGHVIYAYNANCSVFNSKFNISVPVSSQYYHYAHVIAAAGKSILNLSSNEINVDGNRCIPIWVSENTDVVSKTKLTWSNNFTADYKHSITINSWLVDDMNNLIEVEGGIKVQVEDTNIKMKLERAYKRYAVSYTPDFIGIRLVNTTVFSNVTSDVYVIVYKLASVMNITAVPGVFNATIFVKLNTDGMVNLTIDNRNFTVEIKNGTGSVFVPNLKPSNYIIEGVFEGNEMYNGTTAIGSVKIVKQPSNMNITAVPGVFNATIFVKLSVDGMVNLTIDNRNFTVEVKNGVGSVFVPNLKPAKYVIEGVFGGNDYYKGCSAIGYVTIDKLVPTANMKIDVDGTDATIKVFTNANGTLNIIVDGVGHIVPIRDGVAVLTLTDLTDSHYGVVVIYPGNDYYYDFKLSGSFGIGGKILIITAEPVYEFFGDTKCLYINATDGEGHPVEGIFVEFVINGVYYNRTTDSNGLGIKPIDLPIGYYEFDVCFNGDSNYAPITVSSSITIESTIVSENMVKIYGDNTPFSVTFLDKEGNFSKYSSVSFNIIGIFYDEVTDDYGGVHLNIDFNPDTYIATASNPVTGELRSFNLTFLPNMISQDVVKYFRNGTQYEIKLLGEQGNAAPIGSKVVFDINGVLYERTTTDMSGRVKLNINLLPGKYVLKAAYNGLSMSNNITVLSTIQSKDLDISTNNRRPFTGKILNKDGSPAAGAKVTLNINGIFYNKITRSNGAFSLNINFAPGEYIVTTYYGDAARSNAITVKDQ